MKSKTLATLASVVVMSASTITMAQDRGKGDLRGGPPGGRDGGPPMGAGPERGPPQGVQERRSAPDAGERRVAPQERSGPRNVIRERGASERQPRRERAEQPRRHERSAGERERVRPKSDNDRGNVARGTKDDQKSQRATQQNRTPNAQRGEVERKETARDRSDRPNSKMAERRERLHQTRERLGREERQRFRSAFDFRSARVTNVRFDARIGTRIPRHVRLHAVPRTIIALIPDYTYYRYVVIDDVVCIVDPDTYEIVDVIDEGYYTVDRAQVASLDLTSRERGLILDSISPDFPQAEVRLRLALGAEIPTHVEIHSFPDVVLDRIPRLRRFGFIVAQDNVVIADPSDHATMDAMTPIMARPPATNQ